MKRYLTPERLINDDRVDAKMLGMYVVLIANTKDGKHVMKSSDELRNQMKMSKPTYFNYRKQLEELGYISISHNDFTMPSVITLKGDNANFIPFNNYIDFWDLDEDVEPLEAFRALFYVDIPTSDLKRIEQLNIPNHVMRLAFMNVYEHEEEFTYTDYSRMLNYAIKIALDYQDHDVNSAGDAIEHKSNYLKDN